MLLTSESPFIWVYNQTLPTKPSLSEWLFLTSECLFLTSESFFLTSERQRGQRQIYMSYNESNYRISNFFFTCARVLSRTLALGNNKNEIRPKKWDEQKKESNKRVNMPSQWIKKKSDGLAVDPFQASIIRLVELGIDRLIFMIHNKFK